MFFIIYSIYIDAFNFARKNIILFFFSLIFSVLTFFLARIKIPIISFASFWISDLFLLCLFELYLISFVLREEKIINKTPLDIIKKHYKNALWIYVLSGFLLFIVIAPFLLYYRVASTDPNYENIFLIYFMIGVGAFILLGRTIGLCYLIYRSITPFTAFTFGLRELFSGFLYYFFINILGIALLYFPSLFNPIGWASVPLIQIAEYNINQTENLISFIVSQFLSVWVSIAAIYAFLHKNKFQLKSQIQNRKS